MVIGTIVSLYLVPLVYYFVYRKSERNEGNERNERVKK
jgi:hypothetical protein